MTGRVVMDWLPIDDIGFDRTVETLIRWAHERGGGYVCTPNVDHVVRARRDPAFREALLGARLRVPDGMGIVYGARLAGQRLSGTVTGRRLPEAVAPRADSPAMALFGGQPGSGTRAAERLRAAGAPAAVAIEPPMGLEIGSADDDQALGALRALDAPLLFVGLGSPKQELWMRRHAADLPRTLIVGIGSGIDVLAGVQPCAPAWMTRVGLEWAYRLAFSPRRLARRYLLDDPPFFWWAWRERRKRRRRHR